MRLSPPADTRPATALRREWQHSSLQRRSIATGGACGRRRREASRTPSEPASRHRDRCRAFSRPVPPILAQPACRCGRGTSGREPACPRSCRASVPRHAPLPAPALQQGAFAPPGGEAARRRATADWRARRSSAGHSRPPPPAHGDRSTPPASGRQGCSRPGPLPRHRRNGRQRLPLLRSRRS